MRCIRPIKTSLDNEGNLTHSSKNAMDGLVPFDFPCRKCLPCRLNTAREKAIRAWHESQMHENSIFLTLTYAPEHLRSPKLCYPEFQNFMKSLLEKVNRNIHTKENRIKIPYIVTGEYGEENKRPHWHAILFNYRPEDAKTDRTTPRGDEIYTSQTIDKIWNKGTTEFGQVTIESANYTARYAAKKLVHGPDETHDYHPIHKTSSKHAIGKKWIEKYYEQTFSHGYVTLPNGSKAGIPRYYKDWLKKHDFEKYLYYYSEILPKTQKIVEEIEEHEKKIFDFTLQEQIDLYQNSNAVNKMLYPESRSKLKLTLLQGKFKQLQERLKL